VGCVEYPVHGPEWERPSRALTVGTASVGSVTGNGAGWSVPYVGGTTTTKMQWPSGSIPSTFTVYSITRYTGGTYGRILDCSDKNWIHGHYSDAHVTHAGSIYYNVDAYYLGNMGATASTVRYNIRPVTNWVVSCDRKYCNYRGDKLEYQRCRDVNSFGRKWKLLTEYQL
jgi:hypothetical protein